VPEAEAGYKPLNLGSWVDGSTTVPPPLAKDKNSTMVRGKVFGGGRVSNPTPSEQHEYLPGSLAIRKLKL
jgi:hypothetical protein